MNIMPDIGLMALQAIPFAVTLIALHHILFKPLLAYLDERDQAIEGAQAEAQQLRQKADEAQAAWDERLAEARAEGARHRAVIREEANAQRQQALQAARGEAEALVSQALGELGQARDLARAELERSAEDLSGDIVARVLQRPLDSEHPAQA